MTEIAGEGINWAGKDTDFPALPNGVYHAQVTGCMLRKGELTRSWELDAEGEPMDIVDFEYTITDADHQNRKLWDRAAVQSHAWKVKKMFTGLGVWPTEEPRTVEELPALCGQALNTVVEVKVKTFQKKDGTFGNSVDSVKAIDLDNADVPNF